MPSNIVPLERLECLSRSLFALQDRCGWISNYRIKYAATLNVLPPSKPIQIEYMYIYALHIYMHYVYIDVRICCLHIYVAAKMVNNSKLYVLLCFAQCFILIGVPFFPSIIMRLNSVF